MGKRKNKPKILPDGVATTDVETADMAKYDEWVGNPSNRQERRSSGVAAAYPDLSFSSTDVRPFARLEQRAGGFIGQAAFGGLHQDTDGVTNRVSLDRLVNSRYPAWDRLADPDPNRDTWHSAPQSATPPNGTHNPTTYATYPSRAMKSSERVALMKEMLFGD